MRKNSPSHDQDCMLRDFIWSVVDFVYRVKGHDNCIADLIGFFYIIMGFISLLVLFVYSAFLFDSTHT